MDFATLHLRYAAFNTCEAAKHLLPSVTLLPRRACGMATLTRQHAVLLGEVTDAAAGLAAVSEGQGQAWTPSVEISKSPQVGLFRGTQHTCRYSGMQMAGGSVQLCSDSTSLKGPRQHCCLRSGWSEVIDAAAACINKHLRMWH